jgi:hypothetical protein
MLHGDVCMRGMHRLLDMIHLSHGIDLHMGDDMVYGTGCTWSML